MITNWPTSECNDPEIANIFRDDCDPVYAGLNDTQHLQIFRNDYEFTDASGLSRRVTPSAIIWNRLGLDALDRHVHWIEMYMKHGWHDVIQSYEEEPARVMAGLDIFDPYIVENFEPGILFLSGRFLKHIKPRLVARTGPDGDVYYVKMGTWLSECALGFQVGFDHRTWCPERTMHTITKGIL